MVQTIAQCVKDKINNTVSANPAWMDIDKLNWTIISSAAHCYALGRLLSYRNHMIAFFLNKVLISFCYQSQQ